MRSGITLLIDRHGRCNSCTACTGVYLKRAFELPKSLTHSGDAPPERRRTFCLHELFCTHAASVILNLKYYRLSAIRKYNTHHVPLCVPKNIAHALLKYPKECPFGFGSE